MPPPVQREDPINPAPRARNYIYFGGGTITFGKLTMRDADLQLIDADPRDPFDFFPARYAAQLAAGYSLPDFNDLPTGGRSQSRR